MPRRQIHYKTVLIFSGLLKKTERNITTKKNSSIACFRHGSQQAMELFFSCHSDLNTMESFCGCRNSNSNVLRKPSSRE